MSYHKIVCNEMAMLDFGGQVAKHISNGLIIFLKGDLGTGKTTFVRGFLKQLGYNGAVKSPTFTLVESYCINHSKLSKINIFHFDLYRLCDAEELDFMGISDYMDGESIILIEWPEKGEGFLPKADIIININYLDRQRAITMFAQTDQAKQILNHFKD